MGKEVPRSLAAFNSVMTRSYAIILLCICSERLGVVALTYIHHQRATQRATCCYTHRLSEYTLLQIAAPSHAPQLLKHTPLLRLPVPLAPVLEQPVKVCLRLLTPFLNRRYKILLVCVTKIACDIGVLQRLQRCKGCRCVQMRDRIRQRRRIDLRLCK